MLLACAPGRGGRLVQVRKQRTAVDYAAVRKELGEPDYPAGERLQLVPDTFNTPTPGSCSPALAPPEACAWAQQFPLPYPPLKGSWLTMAERELSALARHGLDRRIGDRETLGKEALSGSANRHQARQTVRWKLTKNHARRKLQKKYPTLQN